MLKVKSLLSIAGWVLTLGLLNACAHDHEVTKFGTGGYSHYPKGGGIYVSSTFDKQGRLWRVVPEKNHVYVDSSIDLGKTFSEPVIVNQEPQRIKVSGENLPNIVVDQAGRIYVIYAAEGEQPVTVYSSLSVDKGQSFSTPKPISDKAIEANSFQARMLLSPKNQIYVFWHDERDRSDWRQLGNAIYSTVIDDHNLPHSNIYKVSDRLCECCHIAAAFDNQDQPILLARFIYPDNSRDHGLIETSMDGRESTTKRATFDQWRIEACPEHGPSLAIASDNRFHITWFTQGSVRQGIFYAYSADYGNHFSAPLQLGAPGKLASHPDVITDNQRVILVWLEFNGEKTELLSMQSKNGGQSWQAPKTLAATNSANNYPYLLKSDAGIFVSWNSLNEGYRLLTIDQLE
jgi:hypothetical protein